MLSRMSDRDGRFKGHGNICGPRGVVHMVSATGEVSAATTRAFGRLLMYGVGESEAGCLTSTVVLSARAIMMKPEGC